MNIYFLKKIGAFICLSALSTIYWQSSAQADSVTIDFTTTNPATYYTYLSPVNGFNISGVNVSGIINMKTIDQTLNQTIFDGITPNTYIAQDINGLGIGACKIVGCLFENPSDRSLNATRTQVAGNVVENPPSVNNDGSLGNSLLLTSGTATNSGPGTVASDSLEVYLHDVIHLNFSDIFQSLFQQNSGTQIDSIDATFYLDQVLDPTFIKVQNGQTLLTESPVTVSSGNYFTKNILNPSEDIYLSLDPDIFAYIVFGELSSIKINYTIPTDSGSGGSGGTGGGGTGCTDNCPVTNAPEPSVLGLLALGMLALGLKRMHQIKK